MTKEEELLKSIEESEKYLMQLRKKLEESKNVRIRELAKKDEIYWFLSIYGNPNPHTQRNTNNDSARFKCGNYFKTKEEAKKSLLYHVLNDGYFYWHSGFGIGFPLDYIPEGLEALGRISWISSSVLEEADLDTDTLYRWPKNP